jgi:hypothetical protein
MGRYISLGVHESIVTEEIAHENKGLGTLGSPMSFLGGGVGGEEKRRR